MPGHTLPTSSVKLFLGLSIPPDVTKKLSVIANHYTKYLKHPVPIANWHLTLVFIGLVHLKPDQAATICQPLKYPYLATVNLSHLGRGLATDQLWVYAQTTPLLVQLRSLMEQRVADAKLSFAARTNFAPHIRIGHLIYQPNQMIADTPVSLTFPVKHIHLYRSIVLPAGTRYNIDGTIELIP